MVKRMLQCHRSHITTQTVHDSHKCPNSSQNSHKIITVTNITLHNSQTKVLWLTKLSQMLHNLHTSGTKCHMSIRHKVHMALRCHIDLPFWRGAVWDVNPCSTLRMEDEANTYYHETVTIVTRLAGLAYIIAQPRSQAFPLSMFCLVTGRPRNEASVPNMI